MVQDAIASVPPKTLTFEQYLHHDDGTDIRYELVRGFLLPMTPAPWPHSKIAKFLERQFDHEIARMRLPWAAVRGDVGLRTEAASARLPDVLVAHQRDLDALGNRSAVLEAPAILVVEIVSESSKVDDYLYKLAEYKTQQISEYWIVDYLGLGAARYIGAARAPTVSIYELSENTDEVHQFRGTAAIASPNFPELTLTAEQIFQGG